MLVNFTVGNYRSIKDPITLSMEAEPHVKELEQENCFEPVKGRKLLNMAAIYGANASGKSNLIKAMHFMCDMVVDSLKDRHAGELIDVEPFLLDEEILSKPSHFEMVLLIDGVEYTYGFEITSQEVVDEWLTFKPKSRQTKLFTREKGQITYINRSSFKEGLGIEKRTRSNALFLTTVAQFNSPLAETVIKAFEDLRPIEGFKPDSFSYKSILWMQNDKLSKILSEFLCDLDLAIKRFELEPDGDGSEFKNIAASFTKKSMLSSYVNELAEIYRNIKEIGPKIINTIHVTNSGNTIVFNMSKQESHGTQKLFALAAQIISTLIDERTLIVDELDSQLHPLLTIELLRIFQLNKRAAQIIFTTHDSHLLSNRVNLFRRDQVWFTEKRSDQSTDLYSLIEFGPRKDEALDINYLRGKYGSIPFLGGLAAFKGADSDTTQE